MALFNKKFRPDAEFRPDPKPVVWLKSLHITQQQRNRLLKWGSYTLFVIMSLVLQDVIMGQIRFFGATTELTVCAILLITVIENSEKGSLFVLIAATLYYFSGSAPGAYSIGLLIFLGIFASLLRQMYLNRSRGSIILCAAIAQVLYQIGLYAVGIFSKLTRWDRLDVFLLTAALNVGVMFLMYPMVHRIGLIGGNTWKE